MCSVAANIPDGKIHKPFVTPCFGYDGTSTFVRYVEQRAYITPPEKLAKMLSLNIRNRMAILHAIAIGERTIPSRTPQLIKTRNRPPRKRKFAVTWIIPSCRTLRIGRKHDAPLQWLTFTLSILVRTYLLVLILQWSQVNWAYLRQSTLKKFLTC